MQNRIPTANQKLANSAGLGAYERTTPSQGKTFAITTAADCTPVFRDKQHATQQPCRVLKRPPTRPRKQLGKEGTIISENGHQNPKKSHTKTGATKRNITQVTSVTECGKIFGQLIYGPCRSTHCLVCTAILLSTLFSTTFTVPFPQYENARGQITQNPGLNLHGNHQRNQGKRTEALQEKGIIFPQDKN